MPSFACKHPTCLRFGAKPGYCAEHAKHAPKRRPQERLMRDRFYDQHQRDRDAKAFYNSKAWQLARAIRLAEHPVCEQCGIDWARHVHHVIPLRKCTDSQKLDQDSLRAVCPCCHNTLEAESIYQESP